MRCFFSVRWQHHIQSKKRICIKLLPGLRKKPFHYGDDPDYDPNSYPDADRIGLHNHFAKKDSVASVTLCCAAEVCRL